MIETEIIKLITCSLSILGLLIHCYLFYKFNTKDDLDNFSIIVSSLCNSAVLLGITAFVFYMFSLILSSVEYADYCRKISLAYYSMGGIFFLIAAAIKIIRQWRIKHKVKDCSKCMHKKVCRFTNNDNKIKSCFYFIDKNFKDDEYEEIENDV